MPWSRRACANGSTTEKPEPKRVDTCLLRPYAKKLVREIRHLRFTMSVPAFINHGSTSGAIVDVIIIQGVRP